MRPLFAPLLLFAAVCAGAPAPEPSFKRVWVQWHNTDSFQSFYEYHTGRELTGKWIVLRSQPDERTGLYFLARVENPGAALRGASFVIRVVTPEATQTRVFSFPADVRAGSWLYEIGLTGKDWAAQHVHPVAWEVELQSADGAVLARKASFLWEKPGWAPGAQAR
ncbi:MAG TPA: hypothetical protein VKG78_12335 [Opitutaceae bacterium]|nr:hypothetical protein [Opitutaceae bacterium]